MMCRCPNTGALTFFLAWKEWFNGGGLEGEWRQTSRPAVLKVRFDPEEVRATDWQACWWFVACSNSWLVYYTHSFNFKPTLLLWRWMKGITLLHRQSFFWNVFDLRTKQTCFCFFMRHSCLHLSPFSFTLVFLVTHYFRWLCLADGNHTMADGCMTRCKAAKKNSKHSFFSFTAILINIFIFIVTD